MTTAAERTRLADSRRQIHGICPFVLQLDEASSPIGTIKLRRGDDNIMGDLNANGTVSSAWGQLTVPTDAVIQEFQPNNRAMRIGNTDFNQFYILARMIDRNERQRAWRQLPNADTRQELLEILQCYFFPEHQIELYEHEEDAEVPTGCLLISARFTAQNVINGMFKDFLSEVDRILGGEDPLPWRPPSNQENEAP